MSSNFLTRSCFVLILGRFQLALKIVYLLQLQGCCSFFSPTPTSSCVPVPASPLLSAAPSLSSQRPATSSISGHSTTSSNTTSSSSIPEIHVAPNVAQHPMVTRTSTHTSCNEDRSHDSVKRGAAYHAGLALCASKNEQHFKLGKREAGYKPLLVHLRNYIIPAMNFSNLLFFSLSYMLMISTGPSTGQKCSDKGNFTANSIYGRNRDIILASLASNAAGGFYNASIGQDSDEVFALALCRGDSSAEECFNCVNVTSQEIMTKCPNQKEAYMWGGLPDKPPCIVRYSNRSFFGTLELNPLDIIYNTGNITSDLTEFNQIWENLMDGLVKKASIGTSRLKFATKEANLTYFQRIYALMQCTPDLSQSDCDFCLRRYLVEYQNCCHGKQGGVVRGPNCISRWDLYPFYKITITPDAPPPPPPSPLPPPPTSTITKDNGGGVNSQSVVIIVVSITMFLVLISLAYVLIRKRKAKQNTRSKQRRNHNINGISTHICYDTGNFTTNSSYGRNRDLILSSLASNATEGFYNATIGQKPDKVYALALCSGDISAKECFRCVNFTSQEIMNHCPNQKEAFMWGGPSGMLPGNLPGPTPCLVRYSNRSFSGIMEVEPLATAHNVGDITSDSSEFRNILGNLTDGLLKKASKGTSRIKYATDEANLTPFQTIYALMECTPDLSESDCNTCLRTYMVEYQNCCYGKKGVIVQGPNCMFRWELYQFYNLNVAAPPAISTITKASDHNYVLSMHMFLVCADNNGGENNSRTVVIIVVSIIMFLVLVALAFVFLRKWKAKRDIRSKQGRNCKFFFFFFQLWLKSSRVSSISCVYPEKNIIS
ncbi:hypothetical protein EZV62_026452 [Acer yangbiense]|uniref:Gnk2-homologous domain-containing protein n=1 Tax=Acer yangbiense TaxID=1000413 RepID=A0A5C7GR52_9ROSI|nr:hypothetical protein EZV62_026452 [Acer yangbiense]